MADKPLSIKAYPFTGRLVTAVDSSLIEDDFSDLENMRYSPRGIRGVRGMTKINTSALTTYLKIRNGYHFRKSQPSESHILVQAYNSGETESKVFDNTTAIPSQGGFSATALHTDSSGAGRGRFASSVFGELAYGNGKEACVWGGNELRVARFINYDPNGAFKYDFSNQVQNTLSDTLNKAVLNSTGAGDDASSILLVHFNNALTDDGGTAPAHTLTNNNITFSTSPVKFGSHCGSFNGTTAYATIPDHADFDFSDGTFTIDGWFYLLSMVTNPIYRQQTDANNYINFVINTDGSLQLAVVAASVTVVNVTTPAGTVTTGAFYHIEVTENGNSWYIFVNGIQKGYSSDTDRAANYTGVVQIGYNGVNYFTGYMDELRVSTSNRHTAAFEVPSVAYSSGVTSKYMYVGSIRPLKGIKFYVSDVNTASEALSIEYWDGVAWAAVTNKSDGTMVAGKTFAQTGTVSFDTTDGLSKSRVIDQTILYWYKVYGNLSDGTSIYYITVDAPFQTVKDLWDGDLRLALSFQLYDNSTFNDNTVNVYSEDYSSANTATYSQIGALASATDYLLVGFVEQMMGIQVVLVGGAVNTASATLLTVSYWSGTAWTSVGVIDDGTIEGGKSFAKSGVISWNPPALSSEFKHEVAKEAPLYYYKFVFSQDLSADVKIDFIGGMPAPITIGGYKFPLFSNNRLFLCSNTEKDKNSVLCASKYTTGVFNGIDSTTLYFGDDEELTAAASLYSQFGSNLYNIAVFCKLAQTWILTGDGPENWAMYQASDSVGCPAPLTMKVAHVGFELVPGQSRYVAIWQGANGIYLFDGKTIRPIHTDIEDWFDDKNSYVINRSIIDTFHGFFDEANQEYHWCFASGSSTTLDKEFVFDLKLSRWFKFNRGSGKALQCGIETMDTKGNRYTYGSLDTGYLERLENGTDFDGTAITSLVQSGDLALGGLLQETEIRVAKLITVVKSTTTNSVQGVHYGDTKDTGTSFTVSPSRSGYRLVGTPRGQGWGPAVFHKIKLSMITTNETIGFEPVALVLGYKSAGLDKN